MRETKYGQETHSTWIRNRAVALDWIFASYYMMCIVIEGMRAFTVCVSIWPRNFFCERQLYSNPGVRTLDEAGAPTPHNRETEETHGVNGRT